MSFTDQVLGYKLLKNAISPQTWLKALARRVRKLKRRGRMYPRAVRGLDNMLRTLRQHFKGRTVFSLRERRLIPIITRIVNAATKPTRSGRIPMEARTTKEALRRLREAGYGGQDLDRLDRALSYFRIFGL